LPTSVGGPGFAVGIHSPCRELMLHVQAGIACLQELAFAGNAGRIDCVTEVKTVKCDGYTKNSFFFLSFDPDREVVYDQGALVLN
jgi:hypothetical protein